MKLTPVTWVLGVGIVAACGASAAAVPALETSPSPPAPISPATPVTPPATPLDSTPTSAKMASIPGGTFIMGEGGFLSTDPHSVTVAAFSLDVNLVTAGAYAACVQAGKCRAAATQGPCNTGKSGREKHPINCVDWQQATAYCAFAGKRLPTEEEWEYAGRGGAKATTYSWGNEEPKDQLCWSRSNEKGTCEVGSFPAGAFGLYDMNGNLWQWTSTSTGPERVVKGSQFNQTPGQNIRSAKRKLLGPALTNDGYGFRCAK
jgi:formylglycine-generating enzyme required for sulfatase activity